MLSLFRFWSVLKNPPDRGQPDEKGPNTAPSHEASCWPPPLILKNWTDGSITATPDETTSARPPRPRSAPASTLFTGAQRRIFVRIDAVLNLEKRSSMRPPSTAYRWPSGSRLLPEPKNEIKFDKQKNMEYFF